MKGPGRAGGEAVFAGETALRRRGEMERSIGVWTLHATDERGALCASPPGCLSGKSKGGGRVGVCSRYVGCPVPVR